MHMILNPDQYYVEEVKHALKENNGYCPSVPRSRDTKCKCKAFREQLKRGERGACLCGLYIAVDD